VNGGVREENKYKTVRGMGPGTGLPDWWVHLPRRGAGLEAGGGPPERRTRIFQHSYFAINKTIIYVEFYSSFKIFELISPMKVCLIKTSTLFNKFFWVIFEYVKKYDSVDTAHTGS